MAHVIVDSLDVGLADDVGLSLRIENCIVREMEIRADRVSDSHQEDARRGNVTDCIHLLFPWVVNIDRKDECRQRQQLKISLSSIWYKTGFYSPNNHVF